jgi:hypothetical protein
MTEFEPGMTEFEPGMAKGVRNDRLNLRLPSSPTIDSVHLLIPFASTLAPACRQPLAGLQLPNLARLLTALVPEPTDLGEAQSLSAPHERALARAIGLPVLDGRIAWAALARNCAGTEPPAAALEAPGPSGSGAPSAWGLVTPCHWQMGQDHVTMLDPQSLALSDQDAQDLLRAMQPYFAEDGIELFAAPAPGAGHAAQAPGMAHAPPVLSWLARAELFRNLACASLDRVSNRDVADWMPGGAGARVLRRLQSEMQMLLYTHPLNDARQKQGLLPVNSFWVSGCGALPQGFAPNLSPELKVDTSLRSAALADDAPAYAHAWQELDAGPLAALLDGVQQGQPTRLTLCGERACTTWASAPTGAMARVRRLLRQLRQRSIHSMLEPL